MILLSPITPRPFRLNRVMPACCSWHQAGTGLVRAFDSIHLPFPLLTRPCFFVACSGWETLRLPMSATRVLPLPDRLTMACPQSFKLEAFLSRVRITTAASYNKVRASVSPHLDILPLRSTSPD